LGDGMNDAVAPQAADVGTYGTFGIREVFG
jgi:magnesium-transporting ATPase (P-type)